MLGAAARCCAAWPKATSTSGAASTLTQKQIRHQPADRLERAVAGVSRLRQRFLDAGAEPLLAAFQFFEHRGAFACRGLPLPQAVQFALPFGEPLVQLAELLGGLGGESFVALGAAGKFVAAAAQFVQFRRQLAQPPVQVGHAVAAALTDRLGRARLALQALVSLASPAARRVCSR